MRLTNLVQDPVLATVLFLIFGFHPVTVILESALPDWRLSLDHIQEPAPSYTEIRAFGIPSAAETPPSDTKSYRSLSEMSTEDSTVTSTEINGEVVMGDMVYDGRVILYIIKGILNDNEYNLDTDIY